ncbi:MAG: hypothetical protein JXL80_12830 [Planctomycetes bacterium]|nr:hypothetical protein [Planctomycetota bacterium]
MGLKEYRKKRDFSKTPEPDGKAPKKPAPRTKAATAQNKGSGPTFVVQKHDASHLHYDFRLEAEGVLKSWAVPKGPSLDTRQKRLAVRTEDHPLDYGDFEGTIPEGQYGGGTVMLWDFGTVDYETGEADVTAAVDERKPFTFTLRGTKLGGRWRLVPFNTPGEKKRNWLLIKSKDEAARTEGDVLAESPDSAKTGRSLEEIAAADERWSDKEVSYGD